jgi:hypothetical protein
MTTDSDDRARRLSYAELEAEMNAIATPEWTPEVAAHFQKVFAASQKTPIELPHGAHSAQAGDQSLFKGE